MKFPVFIFRCPGEILRAGNRYAFSLVDNEQDLKARQADGWKLSLKEAIESYNAGNEKGDKRALWRKPKNWKAPKKPSKPIDGINHRLLKDVEAVKIAEPEKVEEVKQDEAPANRYELEQMGRELGLKFDGRTSDKKLNKMIEDALAAS